MAPPALCRRAAASLRQCQLRRASAPNWGAALDQGYAVQFAVSAAAIIVLALVAAWARIPRKVPPLDEGSARAVVADELPDTPIEKVWVDAAGQAAVARAGSEGVVLFRVGDGF